jgi:hypothetical protein
VRKFLFVLASTATLTMITCAIAQYVAPPPTDPLQDRQLREFYEKQRPLDNATGSGPIGTTDPNAVGRECARGFSAETCLRRENAIGSRSVDVTHPTENYVGECAIGSSEETCRRRGQKYNPPRQN